MALKLGFFKVSYSESVSMAPTFMLEEELVQYWYNLIQLISNLSKIIQKNSRYITDVIRFFVAGKGKKPNN